MSELDARCAGCGVVIPDADLMALVAAEEENRRLGVRLYHLLCQICYHRQNSETPEDDGEPPKVYSF